MLNDSTFKIKTLKICSYCSYLSSRYFHHFLSGYVAILSNGCEMLLILHILPVKEVVVEFFSLSKRYKMLAYI